MMKTPRAFVAMFASLSLSCLSCAPALPPLPGQPYAQQREIDVGDYVVTGPPGEGWFVDVKKAEGAVAFSRRHVDPDGAAREMTMVIVARNAVAAGPRPAEALLEEAVADDFRNTEEQKMRTSSALGLYGLSNVSRGVEMIGDKKLYSMHFKTTLHPPNVTLVNDSALYLLFPSDFETRRVFYMFLVGHAHRMDRLPVGDLTPVLPVIQSFRLK